ncbi:MAG: choice-of-anchor tandem repeat GloVer-containing protein [Bacteroidota bacterium]
MKPAILVLLLFCTTFTFSQKTLWGTVQNGGQHGYGYLYRTDSVGDNLAVVHHFDSIHSGKSPGPVIQAINGKLYGMTFQGGNGVMILPGGPTGFYHTQGGTLYEYDPIIDSFRVIIHFNSTDPLNPVSFYNPSSLKLLEVSPGVLWAVMNQQINNVGAPSRQVIAVNISTGMMSYITTVPSWMYPGSPDIQYTGLSGELYKAADGYVYSTTYGYSSIATLAQASNGSIVRIDPSTNNFSYIRPFDGMVYADGWLPQGNFADTNGKLYGYTGLGGPNIIYPTFSGYGVIYEYDPATNTYTKKYDLPGGVNGGNANGYLITANNGKLYGTAAHGPTTTNAPYGEGVLYEYDPVANTYIKKYDFFSHSINDVGANGSLWLKSSSGKLYGTTSIGIFEYNTSTNLPRPASRFSMSNYYAIAYPIIEACIKPSYINNSHTSYTVCAGSFFSYNLHSVNTHTYVWKHNGTADALQTSGTLSFNQVTLADAGTWFCEMTNDCGTTISPTLTLTINSAGTGVVTSTLNASGPTNICPSASITINGNTSGTWNTGSTASAIVVSTPGSYQVANTNACGNTYSNIITIDTIASPSIPLISFPIVNYNNGAVLSAYMCSGDSLLLSGNTNGVWNTGETSYSIYVKDFAPHYVTASNPCKTVTSATAQAINATAALSPTIITSGSPTICVGDSILLTGVNQSIGNGTISFNWFKSGSYLNYAHQIYVKQSGDYYIEINAGCGAIHSQTVHVDANSIRLDTAIITPLSSTVICQGTSVVLQSNYTNCIWSTGAVTPTISVSQPGSYYVTNSNACSSVISVSMGISVIPTPTVTYAEPMDSVCLTTPVFTLGSGSPAGGYYMGTGVTGNTFNAAVIGPGTYTVTYHYQNIATGCYGSATQTIYVDHDPFIAIAGPTVICVGNNAVLYQTTTPYGIWNNGQTAFAISTFTPGFYYVTRTNVCGLAVHSNTIQVISKPSPTITVTGTNSICSGGMATLTGNGGLSYTWTPGGATPSITVSPTTNTTYTVIGDSPNGCLSYALVTVTVDARPSISLSSPTVCSGMPVILTASGASTYTWSTTQTGTSITVTPTVTSVFSITGTGLGLCTNTAAATVVVIPAPAMPVITQSGTSLHSTTAVSYQWYLNGVAVTGATSQTYTPLQNGAYSVVVTNGNGCSATSAVFNLLDTGISAISNKEVTVEVYPNPTSGNFTISTSFTDYEIQITNAIGQLIYNKSHNLVSELELKENGIYFIRIISNGSIYTEKLIVSGR